MNLNIWTVLGVSQDAAAEYGRRALIMLLGIGLLILGIVFIVGSTKAGKAAEAIGELIATKGA